MSGLAKHVREPEEGPEHPHNAVAALFRQAVETMRSLELEAQARAIFAGIFPPPATPVVLVLDETTDELELAMLVEACKRGEKMKMALGAHNALLRIKARAEADLAAAKQRRQVPL